MMFTPETATLSVTGFAALLFAATFLWGGRFHPFSRLIKDRRSVISLGAGAAAAYVFVHLIPELHQVRGSFVKSASIELHYEGMGIYFVALVGFLAFYALEHLRGQVEKRVELEEERSGLDFEIHVGGFAAYVCLVSYLLVQNQQQTGGAFTLFTIAMALHFLSIDHALREGAAYQRVGRWILAGAALFGWVLGQLLTLPEVVTTMLVAFISGAIIMNSSLSELPSEKDGRLFPFLAGGIIYGLILLPLG
jgi:hypothetical protein